MLRTSRTWQAAAGEKSWGTLSSSCGPECWTCGWRTCLTTSGGGREAATSSTGMRWWRCHAVASVVMCGLVLWGLSVVTGSSFHNTTRGILGLSRSQSRMARSSHTLYSSKLALFAFIDLILLFINNHRMFTSFPSIGQEEKEFQERFLLPLLKTLKEQWVNVTNIKYPQLGMVSLIGYLLYPIGYTQVSWLRNPTWRYLSNTLLDFLFLLTQLYKRFYLRSSKCESPGDKVEELRLVTRRGVSDKVTNACLHC